MDEAEDAAPRAIAVAAGAENGEVRIALTMPVTTEAAEAGSAGAAAEVAAALSLEQASDLIEGLIHAYSRARAQAGETGDAFEPALPADD